MDERLHTTRGTVIQETDIGFLCTLFRSNALLALAAAPLDEPQREALVRLQFAAQTNTYRIQFPTALFAVVHYRGEPIGRLILDEADSVACIVDFGLLPTAQHCGLGTAIIGAILVRVATNRTTVRCRVLSTNTASLRMCQRLGFIQICDAPPFVQLEWHPLRSEQQEIR